MAGELFKNRRFSFSLKLPVYCFLFFLFLSAGCSNPSEPVQNILLSLNDAACTEVFLNLSVNNLSFPADVTLRKNGNDFLNLRLTKNDTVITDTLVTPKNNYTYQAFAGSDKSRLISASTPDSTSHNFKWEMKLLGDFDGVLYDAAIINDTLAYAVGAVYKKDSLGRWDNHAYNAVKWDGKNFTPFRIKFEGDYVSVQYPPLMAICAFSPNNIIVSDGGMTANFDGEKAITDFRINSLLSGNINRIFGKSPNDLYVIGNKGSIVHFSNGNWQKIESGTKLDLMDIYSVDGKDFWISGGNFQNYNGILLKGNASGFSIIGEGRSISRDLLFRPYFAGVAKTIWLSGSNTVYFGGNLLQRIKSGQMDLVRSLPGNDIGVNVNGKYQGFISQLRGNSDNDIMMVGEGNTVRHFNGVNWQQLGMPYDFGNGYTWLSVAMKNNIAIAAGRNSSRAIIMILKRE